MFEQYRVICYKNSNHCPEKIFVDIYPAGLSRHENELTHDCLLQMRRIADPGAERVESGIILTDFGNGNIRLKYEPAANYRIRQYQEYIRPKIDPEIIKTFQDMKRRGKNRTLEVSFKDMAVLFDLHASAEDSPVSARQDALIKENTRRKQLAEKKKELARRLARAPYASRPELLLAWKQAKYRGD